MRRVMLVVVGAVLIAATAQMQTRLGTPADERVIQNNRDAHDAAWNKHDARALAALFAPDADRATVNGWFSGRGGIERGYANTFGGDRKSTRLNSSHVALSRIP